jgi:hypothetical protein
MTLSLARAAGLSAPGTKSHFRSTAAARKFFI